MAERHTISISVFKTGHSKYPRSGIISNHYFGRGADVFIVDGESVSAGNSAAREVVLDVAGVHGALRPSELGHPFGSIRALDRRAAPNVSICFSPCAWR